MQASNAPPNTSIHNIHSALAQHLANPKVLSIEEQLFRDALKVVETRRKKDGKLPKIFDDLTSASSLADVHQLLEKERGTNAIWKEPQGKRWMEIFGKFAEKIWYYKGILDAVGSRSKTAVLRSSRKLLKTGHRSRAGCSHMGLNHLRYSCKPFEPRVPFNLTRCRFSRILVPLWTFLEMSKEL